MVPAYFEFAFTSADADETEQRLANTYGHIRIQRKFQGLMNRAAGDERFQIADGRFDGSRISTVAIDQFIFATATQTMTWQDNRDSGDMAGEPAVFRPNAPYTAVNEDTEVRIASFDPVALQRTGRLLYSRDDLNVAFSGPRPLTPSAGRAWLSAFKSGPRIQAGRAAPR